MTEHQIYAAAVLVIGLVTCFFGYRIFRVVLALAGFVAGAMAAIALGGPAMHSPIMTLIAALVGGAVGAVLAGVLYIVGVFLYGAGVGAVLCLVALSVAHAAGGSTQFLLVLAVMFPRFVIIVATAIGGALQAVTGLFVLAGVLPDRDLMPTAFGAIPRHDTGWIVLGGTFVLSCVGIWFQHRGPAPARPSREPRTSRSAAS